MNKQPVMYHQFRRLINTSLLFIYIFIFFSCKQASSPKADAAGFYYFPETNIYLDAASKTYFYSLDSARTWSSYTAAEHIGDFPAGQKFQVTAENNQPVWTQNASHLKKYNGTNLAILSADTGTYNIQEVLAESGDKTIKEKVTPSLVNEEKKKSNFFQRLFGKKKKRN